MTGPLIVLRQSPAWDRITREEYRVASREFCRAIARPPEQMNELVDVWDATFRVSYFEARQAMKEVAQAALAEVRGASFTVDSAQAATGERPICFVDDDDWFAPDLAAYLRLPADRDGVLWTHVAFGLRNALQRFAPAADDTWWCYTNNYAVSAAYVRRRGVDGVLQHWIANQTFRSLRLLHLHAPLSVANKHPASLVYLERGLNGAPSSAQLASLVRGFLAAIERLDTSALGDIEWARPHLDATHRHFSRILASAR